MLPFVRVQQGHPTPKVLRRVPARGEEKAGIESGGDGQARRNKHDLRRGSGTRRKHGLLGHYPPYRQGVRPHWRAIAGKGRILEGKPVKRLASAVKP